MANPIDLLNARMAYARALVSTGTVKPSDTRAERHATWADERERLRQALVAALLTYEPDVTEQPTSMIDFDSVGGTGT